MQTLKQTSHYLLALGALISGWWAGSGNFAASGNNSNHRSADMSHLPPRNGNTTPPLAAMLSRVPGLRARAGNNHEIEWVKWCLQIPDADVPQAIAQLDPRRDLHALRMLYSRWAKLDFPTAWASFLKCPIPAHDLHFYMSDHSSASGLQNSRLNESPKDLIAMRMIASLQASDPDDAKRFLASLGNDASVVTDSGLQRYNINSLKKSVTDAPSKEKDYAAQLNGSPGGGKNESLFGQWISNDPAAAMAWFRQLPQEKQASINLGSLYYQINKMPGADAMELLVATHSEQLQDPAGINATMDGRSYSQRDREYYNMTPTEHAASAIRRWATADAQAALDYVQKLPSNDFQSMLVGQVAGQMVATDSARAIALINQQTGDQTLGMKGLVSGWADQQPQECWQWMTKISDPESLQSCLNSAARQWTQSDPELALQAASKLTDPAAQSKLIQSVTQHLSWNQAELERLRATMPDLPWKK